MCIPVFDDPCLVLATPKKGFGFRIKHELLAFSVVLVSWSFKHVNNVEYLKRIYIITKTFLSVTHHEYYVVIYIGS